MQNFFGLLFFTSLVILVTGLLKPPIISKIFKKDMNRKTIGLIFGISAFIFFMAIGATTPPPTTQNTTTKPDTSNVETKKEVKVTEDIPFETKNQNDSTIERGQTKVQTEGVNGKKEKVYTVTYKNGTETNRELKSETVVTNPVTKVVLVGTKVITSTSTPAQTQTNSSGVVKMSTSGICHAPGTTYYDRTTNFTPYNSLNACLNAGGRLPLR